MLSFRWLTKKKDSIETFSIMDAVNKYITTHSGDTKQANFMPVCLNLKKIDPAIQPFFQQLFLASKKRTKAVT